MTTPRFNYVERNLQDAGLNSQQIVEASNFLTTLSEVFERPSYQRKVSLPANWASMSGEEKARFFEDGLYDTIMIKMNGEKIIDETILPHDASLETKANAKETIFSLARQLVSMYAESASTTIDLAKIKKQEILDFIPGYFEAAAQNEIVMTKTLNADGTYNTTFSSKKADWNFTYDHKGKIVRREGPIEIEKLTKALFTNGYNAHDYLGNAEVWFSPDASGKTPESTVTDYVVRSRNDDFALEAKDMLDEILEDAEVQHVTEIADFTTLSMEEATQNIALLSASVRQGKMTIPDNINIEETIQTLYPTATPEEAWTSALTASPELFAFLPSKFFEGEKPLSESLLQVSKNALKERISKQERVSEQDVAEITNISSVFSSKIQLEKDRIRELEESHERKNEALSIIDNLGRDLK